MFQCTTSCEERPLDKYGLDDGGVGSSATRATAATAPATLTTMTKLTKHSSAEPRVAVWDVDPWLSLDPTEEQLEWLSQHCPGPRMIYTGAATFNITNRHVAVLHGFELGDWFPLIPYEELKAQLQPPILDGNTPVQHIAFRCTDARGLENILRDRSPSCWAAGFTDSKSAIHAQESLLDAVDSKRYSGVILELDIVGCMYDTIPRTWQLKQSPFCHLRLNTHRPVYLLLNKNTTRIKRVWLEFARISELFASKQMGPMQLSELPPNPTNRQLAELWELLPGPHMSYTGSVKFQRFDNQYAVRHHQVVDQMVVLHSFDLGDWFPYHTILQVTNMSPLHIAFQSTNYITLQNIVRDKMMSTCGAVYARESLSDAVGEGYYSGVVLELEFVGDIHATNQTLGPQDPLRHVRRWGPLAGATLYLNPLSTRITRVWVDFCKLNQ